MKAAGALLGGGKLILTHLWRPTRWTVHISMPRQVRGEDIRQDLETIHHPLFAVRVAVAGEFRCPAGRRGARRG